MLQNHEKAGWKSARSAERRWRSAPLRRSERGGTRLLDTTSLCGQHGEHLHLRVTASRWPARLPIPLQPAESANISVSSEAVRRAVRRCSKAVRHAELHIATIIAVAAIVIATGKNCGWGGGRPPLGADRHAGAALARRRLSAQPLFGLPGEADDAGATAYTTVYAPTGSTPGP